MNPVLTPADADYWLDYWCAVHEHVVDEFLRDLDDVTAGALEREGGSGSYGTIE